MLKNCTRIPTRVVKKPIFSCKFQKSSNHVNTQKSYVSVCLIEYINHFVAYKLISFLRSAMHLWPQRMRSSVLAKFNFFQCDIFKHAINDNNDDISDRKAAFRLIRTKYELCKCLLVT